MKNSELPSKPIQSVGVLGAGAWGTALAQVAATAGRTVTIWAFENETAVSINTSHENTGFLPGLALHPAIKAETRLEALADCDVILAVTPAQHMRAMLVRLKPLISESTPLVLCAKGIEQGSGAVMSQVAAAVAPRSPTAVLSGPGFAKDVARGLPTATTVAAADSALGEALVAALGQPAFRPYLTDDVIGAEIGGAVKNVIAIACGIAEGRKLGDSARAALITRGFAEMTRFGVALGARAQTVAGLSGLGDLVLTCSSLTSRNMSLGAALSAGRTVAAVMAERRSVAEGAATAPALAAVAQRFGVEMPICAAVDAVLAGRISVDAAIEQLLARPFRGEGV